MTRIVALAVAILLGAGVATAVAKPAASAPVRKSETGALVSRVIAALKTRMPAGVRIESVDLGCKPPPGATIRSVAPGISVLRSRGFVVELQADSHRLICSAQVKAERPVLAAVHDIEPNRPVSGKDFATAWVDAFGGALGSLESFPDGGPYVSATMIRAGQPLYSTQLTRPIAVHPGEMVTVMVRNGPVVLRTRLEARAVASVGDSAPMVNPGSGAVVAATVTGVRTAEVVLR